MLTDRLGEIGKKVHTGRSRNDQIALDQRLYLRHAIPELQSKILILIEVLTEIAEKNVSLFYCYPSPSPAKSVN